MKLEFTPSGTETGILIANTHDAENDKIGFVDSRLENRRQESEIPIIDAEWADLDDYGNRAQVFSWVGTHHHDSLTESEVFYLTHAAQVDGPGSLRIELEDLSYAEIEGTLYADSLSMRGLVIEVNYRFNFATTITFTEAT